MFKNLFLISTLLLFSFGLLSQSIVVINVNDILENMDEYKQAQGQLNNVSEDFRQRIMQEQEKVKSMYNEYEAEAVLMTEEMKRKKEDDIMQKEKEVSQLQRGLFGPEGELFQKRQELVQPIENKVFAAITEYTEERNIDFVFDKSSTQGLIFASEKYDKTEEIKKKLGIK